MEKFKNYLQILKILIPDIKKTLGFPRNDGNFQNYFQNLKILISDIKKTLGFPQKKSKITLKNSGNVHCTSKENRGKKRGGLRG